MGNNINKKSIFTASLGTFLEWYEFGVFGYLASYLSRNFLPSEDKFLGLIYMLGIFGLAYITRPLGGLVFGYIGDKYGRKKSIVSSSLLITISMLLTTVLPTYKEIGITAIFLLILSRLLQGMSVGGEYSGTLVLLIEQADETTKKRRGLIGAIGAVNANLGFFSSIFLVAILDHYISHESMISWGWRIPFGVGLILGVLFFIARTSISEPKVFQNIQEKSSSEQKKPISDLIRNYKAVFFKVFIMNLTIGVLYSGVFVFIPDLLKVISKDNSISMMVNVSLLIFSLMLLLSGYLSDIFGRKGVVIYPSILLLGCIVAFYIFDIPMHAQMIVYALLLPFPTNAVNLLTTELFPTKCRFTGMGVSFNLANIAGGFTPMLLMIIYKLNNTFVYISAIFIFFILLLIFVVTYATKETAFEELS